MRKYIRSMREQIDNNSSIFHQAKRLFHYDPAVPPQRAVRSKPSRPLRDDYSSVHRNENANDSSWIAKLVGNIEDISAEEIGYQGMAGTEPLEAKTDKKDFQSIQSDFLIVDEQHCPSLHPTKKNSRLPVQHSSSLITQKNSCNLNHNNHLATQKNSQSLSCKKEALLVRQEPVSNSRESQKPKPSKKTEGKGPERSEGRGRRHSQVEEKEKEAKTRSQQYGRHSELRGKVEDSLSEIEEIKCITETKGGAFSLQEDDPDQPLFGVSLPFRRRNGCGSIRKNHPNNSTHQIQEEPIESPKFPHKQHQQVDLGQLHSDQRSCSKRSTLPTEGQDPSRSARKYRYGVSLHQNCQEPLRPRQFGKLNFEDCQRVADRPRGNEFGKAYHCSNKENIGNSQAQQLKDCRTKNALKHHFQATIPQCPLRITRDPYLAESGQVSRRSREGQLEERPSRLCYKALDSGCGGGSQGEGECTLRVLQLTFKQLRRHSGLSPR